MDYKYSCVVDTNGYYKTIVVQFYREVYGPPPLAEDGTPDWSQAEARMEWVPESYTLAEGEQLVDTTLPPMCPYAGADGLVRPRWNDDTAAWEEGATEEEIAVWAAEHPAPEPPGPTPQEQIRADIDYLAALGGVAL